MSYSRTLTLTVELYSDAAFSAARFVELLREHADFIEHNEPRPGLDVRGIQKVAGLGRVTWAADSLMQKMVEADLYGQIVDDGGEE